jgi:hypothetical protein
MRISEAAYHRLRNVFSYFNRRGVVFILLMVSVVTLYSLTLMLDVSHCASKYCDDTAEFQVALAAWGTVHPTGYPLYMLLGSPLISAWRALGVPPAVGSSLYSLIWQAAAIAGVFLLIYRETRQPWLSGLTALALAVTHSMWIHGSIPEVYSLNMALTVWILWLTLTLRDRWVDRTGWWLALAGGLGVAHHRLLAVMLPAVGLYLLPAAWRSGRFWRWLGVATLCFLAGFLPYLDILFRAWHGSTWLYSQINTWNDFWRIFWGSEYLRPPNMSLTSVLTTAQKVGDGLGKEMTLAGVGFSLIGALIALIKIPKSAILWWGIGLSYLVFALLVSNVMLEAKLMPIVLCLLVGCALGIAQLRRGWRIGACGLLLAGSSYLIVWQYPVVTALTHNKAGRQYIEQVEKLEAPPGAIVMGLWGQSFFDLAYAQRFEGRLSQWHLVDHRADFKALSAQADGRVYMSADVPYVFTVAEWRQRLGEPLRLTSAGPGLLAVTAHALPAPSGELYAIGDGIALAGWEVRQDKNEHNLDLDVVTYWVATRAVTKDYSTYVHVTDKEYLLAPEDLLGQSDFYAPVYGWYPTSQWQPNETVREDHLITLPLDCVPRTIIVGMYQPQANGQLIPLGHITLTRNAETWKVRPESSP